MPLPKEQTYTLSDIYALPDGERAELIDGKLYAMAPPNYIHQKLVSGLHYEFTKYIKSKGGSCEVLPAPFAVNLHGDDKTYVEPDLSIICDHNKITPKGCSGAPDLIVEIVSPSSRKMDYNKKNALYSDANVREYWIVDPMKNRTTIYYYEEDAAPTIIPFDHVIEVGIFEDLSIDIANLIN